MEIQLDLNWQLGQGHPERLESELFALLSTIKERGSLQVAARENGVSYRHAWGLMQKWKALLGQPLARLERGRGATLTPMGEKLLWGQRRISARLAPELDSLASELATELHGLVHRSPVPPLRIFASHGLAMPLLRDLLQSRTGICVDLQFRGSLDSLRLFGAGKCDLAGFHLPEGALGVRLAPKFTRLLNPRTDELIKVVRRRQGLVTAAGNPVNIGRVEDLTRAGVRFINRQPGSGTRLLLDLLLEDAGIEPQRIQGYGNEEFTHLAVAAMVASGAADAGIAIEPAARQFGLHFQPVADEGYWLAGRRTERGGVAQAELLTVLRSPEFRRAVSDLQGYDAGPAGELHSISEVFPPQSGAARPPRRP
ncbi:MAG: helix-turn-helix transcriptional regulator [Gammaproteobacteria bacterium]|nr:helix-turn-helix transcriptional regulator [Gammaproteobacteria bacterium]